MTASSTRDDGAPPPPTDDPFDAVPRRTALHAAHLAAGARMVDFAGWSMPVSYGSDLAEHHAVRQAAGLFDLSHMGLLRVRGPEAAAFLDAAVAGRMSALAERQSKYTMLLSAEGGILDDLVVTRLPADEGFAIVANAGNRDVVFSALRERAAGFAAVVRPAGERTAILAVQGPSSRAVLEALPGLAVEEGAPALGALRYYRTTAGVFEGVPVLIGRTGYTGEDGFELFLDDSAAPSLWAALLEAGRPHGLVPCGLAARDTLRLEAGMPLYGHELSLETTPAQAGLGRVVDETKERFVGKGAVTPPGARVLVGLAAEGRRAGRAGFPVLLTGGDGPGGDREAGVVTSGALSPSLGHPIAMALVEPALAEPGTALAIRIRDTLLPASVVTLPFYRKATR